MDHHNCILDISKLLAKTHEKLIENICKELDAEEHIETLVKKFVSNDIISKLKPKKDPSKPKKPKSGYMFFCDEHRASVMKKNKDAKMGDVSKLLGKMWKQLSNEEKEPYAQMNEEAKEEYTEAMKNYNANA